MAQIARHGDTITRGGVIQARTTKVFVNGLRVAMVGDIATPHPHVAPHHTYIISGATIIGGSSKDFGEGGFQIARIGDPLSCGCFIITGSENVDSL